MCAYNLLPCQMISLDQFYDDDLFHSRCIFVRAKEALHYPCGIITTKFIFGVKWLYNAEFNKAKCIFLIACKKTKPKNIKITQLTKMFHNTQFKNEL